MEGPERSQEALRGLEEPTVCTKKVLDSSRWSRGRERSAQKMPERRDGREVLNKSSFTKSRAAMAARLPAMGSVPKRATSRSEPRTHRLQGCEHTVRVALAAHARSVELGVCTKLHEILLARSESLRSAMVPTRPRRHREPVRSGAASTTSLTTSSGASHRERGDSHAPLTNVRQPTAYH